MHNHTSHFLKHDHLHQLNIIAFNARARDENAVVQKIFAMKAIGSAASDMNNLGNTFNSKDPSKRIDYIFYTKNSIEYISGKVLNQFGQASDHLPLEMKFRIK